METWNAKVADQKNLISKLEEAVAELQKPDGKREGLIRSAAEYRAMKEPQSKSVKNNAGNERLQEPSVDENPEGFTGSLVRQEDKTCGLESQTGSAKATEVPSQELALSKRLAAAMRETPHIQRHFEAEDFEREFPAEGGDHKEQLLRKLPPERRLLWEIQNPTEVSIKVDRRLHAELLAANRSPEADLLLTLAGPASVADKQYRPLLWLRHQNKLNAAYSEPTQQNTSLLTAACQAGFTDVALELLQRSADVNHATKDCSTPLLAACDVQNWDCARLLLESRADVNQVVGGSSTLTRLMAKHSQALALLHEYHADLNSFDGAGHTALMVAASQGNECACRALLTARADPHARSAEGKTAVSEAQAGKHYKLAAWLDAQE